MTCEYCGADAVDAQGICQNCGRRAVGTAVAADNSLPSLAETRPADIPAPANIPARARSSGTGAPRGIDGRSSNQPSFQDVSASQSGSVTTRYCGTCGAPIEPGRQFCGQCGTPVTGGGISGAHEGTVFTPVPSASGRYANQSGDEWAADDYDAPTEAFAGITPGRPFGYGPSAPYARSGMHGAGAASGARQGMSREMRILLGIACILAGLMSGAGAIILAYLR